MAVFGATQADVVPIEAMVDVPKTPASKTRIRATLDLVDLFNGLSNDVREKARVLN